jgi:hypothetical protein
MKHEPHNFPKRDEIFPDYLYQTKLFCAIAPQILEKWGLPQTPDYYVTDLVSKPI